MKKSLSGPEAILEKKKRFLIPCVFHFYRDPPLMTRGEGARLVDDDGKAYLDFYSGVSVHALGHCHPEVTDVICRQVRTLQHTTTIYLTEQIVDLAERLAGILPGALRRSFFCASGSEANEGAALLATLHTGSSRFFALRNGLHGRTKLTMSLTGLDLWRTDPDPVGDITHLPPPSCFRCPMGKRRGECALECAAAVGDALARIEGPAPAAFFIEPVQGNGGIVVPPAGYMERLKGILEKNGVLLVADEVQTGFGRTGRMFAMEHWGVEPDIVTGGKALGGGTPVGFFSTTDGIASSYTKPGASTFGGNPVTAAAGAKVIEIIERDGLAGRARETGAHIRERLDALRRRFPFVGDVRGLGLMIGAELVEAGGGAAGELTDEVLERLKERGILLGKTGPGRNVLTLMPPLTIGEEDVELCLEEIEAVFSDISQGAEGRLT